MSDNATAHPMGTAELELEVAAARRRLADLESQLAARRLAESVAAQTPSAFVSSAPSLTAADVELYSRQMLVDGIGAAGMERIRRGRVLLIGVGGLGSTAALFLAAAGVGELRLVDFDRVERSNLHRQVIHAAHSVGASKAESARRACLALNPTARVVAHTAALCAANADALVRDCDVVLDCSDNVGARYLAGDAAAAHGRPLVSGSALRWDGQLAVYARGGPCYRCLFPAPPPAAAVGSCGDAGVVGPVPGAIGCLQALEALKLLAGAGGGLVGRLLLLDGRGGGARVVRLRERRADCAACAAGGGRSVREWATTRAEYAQGVAGCALPPPGDVEGVGPAEMARRVGGAGGVLLDVRSAEQFDMARLPHAVSLPLARLQRWERDGALAREWERFFSNSALEASAEAKDETVEVFVICRRGVSSTAAVKLLQPLEKMATARPRFRFLNVDGGLNRYSREVDAGFPYY